jgi:4-hydroxymandelate oxidase
MLKAIALGASAVLLGRPQMHALAVAGMLGGPYAVSAAELELAMAQTGCASLDQIGPGLLTTC